MRQAHPKTRAIRLEFPIDGRLYLLPMGGSVRLPMKLSKWLELPQKAEDLQNPCLLPAMGINCGSHCSGAAASQWKDPLMSDRESVLEHTAPRPESAARDTEPGGKGEENKPRSAMRLRHPRLVGVLCASLVIVAFYAAVVCQFGSLWNGSRYLRGANSLVHPTLVIVEEGIRGQKREATVTVRNLTFSALRIVGAATTCNCVLVDGLPLTIPPRGVQKLRITVYLESSTEEVDQTVAILIDEGRLNRVPVLIRGRCCQPKQGEDGAAQ